MHLHQSPVTRLNSVDTPNNAETLRHIAIDGAHIGLSHDREDLGICWVDSNVDRQAHLTRRCHQSAHQNLSRGTVRSGSTRGRYQAVIAHLRTVVHGHASVCDALN